jgi:CPA1 family monovalent cation:H+ antiporter
MEVVVTATVSLLIVAIVVALIARRLAFPYTIGLVITGIGLALTRPVMDVVLTHEFIFDVILPPLLFEAAINIHWKELRRDALPILTLALIGTIISAGVVATGMVFGLSWPVAPALLFGVLIAATDPVAVIAMFKDNGIEGRLRLLVESESLFNDGVAAVLFSLVLAGTLTIHGQAITAPKRRALLFTVGGGIFIGIASAGQ